MISIPRSLLAAPVLGALVLAGCGGGGSKKTQTNAAEAPIRQVIAQLGSFSRTGNGADICNRLLTRNLEVSIRRASKTGSCTSEVLRNVGGTSTNFTVKAISVKRGFAVVTVQDQKARSSQLLMQRVNGAWKIARIG